MPNSFFRISAFKGPTPFRYSMGLSNMEGVTWIIFYVKIRKRKKQNKIQFL